MCDYGYVFSETFSKSSFSKCQYIAFSFLHGILLYMLKNSVIECEILDWQLLSCNTSKITIPSFSGLCC